MSTSIHSARSSSSSPANVALGAFLRAMRARIEPVSVGISSVGQRRVPGLRREEVAQLAGVGIVWYTWLEQGRDVNVSSEVLERLYAALELRKPSASTCSLLLTTAHRQMSASKAERSRIRRQPCSAGLQMRRTSPIRGGTCSRGTMLLRASFPIYQASRAARRI